MKSHIKQLLQIAVKQLQTQAILPTDIEYTIQIDHTRDPAHGDYASNLALILAQSPAVKSFGLKPRDIAQHLVTALNENDDTHKHEMIKKVEIAGPGFINFHLAPTAFHHVIQEILAEKSKYGHSTIGANKKVQIEFVSANPTGPLHVGHGRAAAFGATIADLLAAMGCEVEREYYVNDAGRQMDILATSVWLRYLQSFNEDIIFPSNGYKGEYILAIANKIREQFGENFKHPATLVMQDLPADADESGGGDKEAHIDALIAKSKSLLGETNYTHVFNIAVATILTDIKDDLKEFGVEFQQWFSEQSLKQSSATDRTLDRLREQGHLYERDGALWFNATAFGDDKDRVLVRENGQMTYFATDIAYHLSKYERGFEQMLVILGADHHGYVKRIKGSVTAMGLPADRLDMLLVQFVTLYRGSERVQMSTRSGSFVTLRELRAEVGNDAARFFYIMRKNEQHMDFDLELAKSQSSDNPVYYIQYAHARICSVFRQLVEKSSSDKNWAWEEQQGLSSLAVLDNDHEKAVFITLSKYKEILQHAAFAHEPYQLATYLRELANDFHTYYNAHQFLIDNAAQRNARLCLISAIRYVLANGLKLLGVSAPESM